MKTTLFVSAASILMLSACASVETSTAAAGSSASAAGASGTMYCWKRNLEDAGGNLRCNWESSSRDACRSIAQVQLGKGSVSSGPRDAGRCENGEWLVAVTTK